MNPDLLAQLHDIHAAPPVSWWPPASGWWLLAILLLAMLALAGRFLIARLRVHRRRQQMLGWIDTLEQIVDPAIEPQAYLSMLNRVFKRVALWSFPEEHCAAMSGSDWVEFLCSKFNRSQALDALAVLATGPFDPAPKFDHARITELARCWIKQYG